MQKLNQILKYFNYRFGSTNVYNVHSPFLYDLITNIFDDKEEYPEYLKVEQLKRELLKNKILINVTDMGAGSKVDKGDQRLISSIAKNSSKSKKIGRLLFRLVKDFQVQNVLELGTSLGLSSMYLSLAIPDSKIITIEGCPNIAKIAKANFEKFELRNIEINIGNFDDILPEVLKSNENFDFVFIDGNHREEPTIRYFEQCLEKATNETLFVFDDIHWSEGMENAWRYIQDHQEVTLTVDIFHLGLVFLRKELTKEHFIIQY